MQPSSEAPDRQVNLNCFEGRPTPQIVIKGWKALSDFPTSSWEPLWILLTPLLMNPGNAGNQELVALFVKEHDIPPEKILAAVGCCELLLKRAAALNIPKNLFLEDLEAIADGEAGDLIRFMGQRFPEIQKGLRQQILMESLATHGKVLSGLDWRLDKIQESSKGNHLDTDIVLLTLHYLEGPDQSKITLQLTPDSARKLKIFCDRIGGTAK